MNIIITLDRWLISQLRVPTAYILHHTKTEEMQPPPAS